MTRRWISSGPQAHISFVVAFGFELVNGFKMYRFAHSRWWMWSAPFVVVLIGMIIFTAGLMLFPALTLGPIVEGLMH